MQSQGVHKVSSLLKLPLNKVWKEARDKRNTLYNNPAWYSPHWWVRDRVQAEWEKLTLVMRQEESKAGVNDRKKYQLL